MLKREIVQEIEALSLKVSDERKQVLDGIARVLIKELAHDKMLHLNFICTHNSRRSQLSQAWAAAIAEYYRLPISTYSGGSEVTAFHPNAIQALEKSGFDVKYEKGANPICTVTFSKENSLLMYSKLFSDTEDVSYIALMTCADADQNCPFIPTAKHRLKFTFEDPKVSDGTENAAEVYYQRSIEIAAQINYIFSQL